MDHQPRSNGASKEQAKTPELLFPLGTPVCVTLTVDRRGQPFESQVVGVVEAWESLPTGSWFVHGRKDRLWLKRLKLRKVDGEISLLVLDDLTAIARLEAVPPDS